MQLTHEERDFVEQMGLIWERLGGTRTSGRVHGLLMIADKPLSLNEITALLQVSKASISTNARVCEQLGLAQRVSVPGDRRDYYEASPGSFERAITIRLQVAQELIRLARHGLTAIDEANLAARTRLTEMRDFYEFAIAETNEMVARWRAEQDRNKSRKQRRM
jgi:DNA-binding transcriptional regulator GbsR (MarR family)